MGKKARSGSRMFIPNQISESLGIIFWVKIPALKFIVMDPDTRSGILLTLDPGSGILLTLGPGWEKFGSGINIPDPQHCCFR
jgi:hypothetical protein